MEATKDTSKQLGEERITKLLIKFSIPGIIGMLVNAFYNVVDRIFVGNGVGSLGIAAITVAFPVMLLLMAFSMLIGVGASTLVSIRLGQQKKEEAERIIGNALVLSASIAIVISATSLIFLEPLLRLCGASDAVLPYAKDFTTIILLGSIFQIVSMGMNNFIRAEGNPKIAMYTMLIGALLNCVLNPIFIFGLRLGIRGSALATVVSTLVSAAWVMWHFIGGRSTLKIRPENFRIRLDIATSIISIGMAPFAMQLAASLVNIILNTSLKIYGGDIAISGMGIVSSILTLFLMPLFGINQGLQPIIGYNFGARKYNRVKQALKEGIFAGVAIASLGFIVTRVFPVQLVSLFTENDTALIAFGVKAMKINLILLPIIGFQVVGANYFQAVGKPIQAALLGLSRQVLVLIPTLLILPRFLGITGVLAAGPVSDLIAAIFTVIWLIREMRILSQEQIAAAK
ncbi:MAG: MATE family efflux transporter [Bacillota bacterium]|jgi:putative MATE family efflux protein